MSTKGGKMGKYPEGAINQHKSLATGGKLAEADTRKLGGGFDGGPATKGRTNIKSGCSTGSKGK